MAGPTRLESSALGLLRRNEMLSGLLRSWSLGKTRDLRRDPPSSTVPRENFGGAGRPGKASKQYKGRKKEPKESSS